MFAKRTCSVTSHQLLVSLERDIHVSASPFLHIGFAATCSWPSLDECLMDTKLALNPVHRLAVPEALQLCGDLSGVASDEVRELVLKDP